MNQLLPRLLVLENVSGFEKSDAYSQLVRALERNYRIETFLLSPQQFGFPNSRERFYLVAVRRINDAVKCIMSGMDFGADASLAGSAGPSSTLLSTGIDQCISPRTALSRGWNVDSAVTLSDDANVYDLDFTRETTHCPHGIPFRKHMLSVGDFLMENSWSTTVPKSDGDWGTTPMGKYSDDPFIVPDKILQKRSSVCLDVVYPQCQHSACFTKAYSRYFLGTGSVVCPDRKFAPTNNAPFAEELGAENNLLAWSGRLRFFTPLEEFRMLGFPAKFRLPPRFPVKSAWAAAGNSLNPSVVASVLLFCKSELLMFL